MAKHGGRSEDKDWKTWGGWIVLTALVLSFILTSSRKVSRT